MTNEEITAALEAIDTANAMIAAADGYADDEMVWFAGHQWSAGRLREEADDVIDANIDGWALAQEAEMVASTRGYHTNF
jgi:uncharacterized protein YdaT